MQEIAYPSLETGDPSHVSCSVSTESTETTMINRSGSDIVDVSVAAYSEARYRYKKFSEDVRDLVGSYCGKDLIHTTEFRAKTISSFERKCRKLNDDGNIRYTDPLKDNRPLGSAGNCIYKRLCRCRM